MEVSISHRILEMLSREKSRIESTSNPDRKKILEINRILMSENYDC